MQGKVREEMWGSVLGPHTLTYFSTPPPFLSPRANTLPYSPHIFPYLPTHFPTPPPTPPIPLLTAPLTSPYNPTHFPTNPCTLPHLYPHPPPQFQLCGEVTM